MSRIIALSSPSGTTNSTSTLTHAPLVEDDVRNVYALTNILEPRGVADYPQA